jgi:LysR family transcriptional regulator, hydrogen peroxide-inducible genes activator
MNLRDLKYIVAVAETRHFGRAATRCFVSQPTLSGQIKKLEDELGVVVFERTNRSVEITPVGESILAHARLALEQASAIEQVARAHQDPMAGPLRIGAIPTLSPYLMPLILVPLKHAYPKLTLVLSEELTDALLARLHRHELDAPCWRPPRRSRTWMPCRCSTSPFGSPTRAIIAFTTRNPSPPTTWNPSTCSCSPTATA